MLLPDRSSLGWKPPPETRENLYHELEQRGYVLCLLHSRQTHQFHERQGLRAKTDRLDAMTIARVAVRAERREPAMFPANEWPPIGSWSACTCSSAMRQQQ